MQKRFCDENVQLNNHSMWYTLWYRHTHQLTGMFSRRCRVYFQMLELEGSFSPLKMFDPRRDSSSDVLAGQGSKICSVKIIFKDTNAAVLPLEWNILGSAQKIGTDLLGKFLPRFYFQFWHLLCRIWTPQCCVVLFYSLMVRLICATYFS